jgi:hypothetical protein
MLGLVAGAGALLRGNMLVLLPVFALWPLVRARRVPVQRAAAWRACAAFVLGALLALAPVALRNHHVGGRFVLTTSGAGTNVYGGNNLENPFGVATEFAWVRGIPEHEAGDWRREASRRAGRELDASETSAYWMSAALESMREHPLEHARILWRKLRLTLGSYEVPDNHFIEWDARYVAMLALPWPAFAFTGTLALAGVLLFLARGRHVLHAGGDAGAARELVLVAAAYLATVVLTVTSERIRLPLVPLLAPFAGLLVVDRLATPWRWTWAAPALALSAVIVLVPVLPAAEREADFDERDFNFAATLLARGDLEHAAPLVDALLARRGASPRVQVVAAEFEYRRARAELDHLQRGQRASESAQRSIESALARCDDASVRGSAQERFRAHVLAGAIRQYLGQWTAAERDYRAARTFDAENRDVRRRLAVVVAELALLESDATARAKRLDEAIGFVEALLREADDRELHSLLAQFRASR